MYKKTSESFNNLIIQSGRTFRARILIGETALEGFSNIKITSGSNNGEALTLGSTISQCAEITMVPPDISLSGKEFELQIGLVIDEDVEYVPIGLFTSNNIKKKKDQITLQSYDRMMKLSIGYNSSLSDNTNTIAVLNEISEKTGVPISTDGLTAIAMVKPVGYTCREVLMYIAQLYGCFANVNREGAIELHFWEDSGYELTAEQGIVGFSHGEKTYQVESIACSVGQDDDGNSISYVAGTGTNRIIISNPFMTQSILNNVYSKIKGFVYSAVECPVILGDPRLDPWDVINITDAEGNEYNVPIMSLSFNYDGGLKCTISSTVGSESEATYDYKGPMAQFEERITAKILIVESLAAKKVSADELDAKVAEIGYLKATEADIKYATIANLNATNATINTLTAKAITTDNLSAKVAELGYAKVAELEAVEGKIDTLASKSITTDNLSAEVAELGYLTANGAELKYATITLLNATDAKITELSSKAITTENLTAKVADLGYAKITELEATDAKITTLTSKAITTENLTAKVAELGYLKVDDLDAEVAEFGYLKTSELEAEVAELGYLKATTAEVTYATITKLNATTANVSNLQSSVASIEQALVGVVYTNDLTAINGNISNLQSKVATIEKAYMDEAKVNTLIADKGYLTEAQIDTLVAGKGYITSLETKNLLANYATIDLANVKNGSITTAMIGTGVVNTAQIADGSITDAKIVALTANKITAGTLSVERLEIRGSTKSIVYELNNITGALQSQNVDTLNGEILTTRSITADKIVANAITANEIAAKTITANEIAANTITAAEIAAGTITATQIKSGTITATQISSGAITTDKLAANAVTAAKINVTDLFAQDISATGSITGLKFISDGEDNDGYPSKMTLDSGDLHLTSVDGNYTFETYVSGHHSTYEYKVTGGAYNYLKLNGNYLELTLQPNGNTGASTSVFKASASDNLVSCSNLAVAGTTTLSGNLTGKYLTGTWLQATATTDLGAKSGKIAVLDASGWVYYRTPEEILSDIGAAASTHAHNYAGSSSVGGAATSAITLSGLTATIGELNYCDGVTSNIQTQLNSKMDASISSLELNANGTLTNYGGFIDFHFNGSTADYTSRIIESTSGILTVTGGLKVTGALSALQTLGVTGTATFGGTASFEGIAAFNNTAEFVGNAILSAPYKGSTTYPMYGARVLYSSTSGTTGNVTLSESAANFTWLYIIVGFSDTGAAGSSIVYQPNGKTVDVVAGTVASSSFNLQRVRYAISGTTMKVSNNYKVSCVSSGTQTYSSNTLYCKAVIGFK